tara:strand:+ start:3736 stop:3921 length:186 start_codon:yes stop_codon:yes gene_type:complete
VRLIFETRGVIMVMLDIAEWIVNLFLLGVSFILWCIGFFMVLMLLELYQKYIKEIFRRSDA